MTEGSKETLGVALMGYGYAGKTFHAPLIAGTSNFRLHSVLSRDEEKVKNDYKAVQVHANPDDIFNDAKVDLVVIATPNDTHFDLARRALLKGKHVVVDKPFTTSADEASQLIEIANREKLVLSVFHNRRWDADFLTIRKLSAENRLGDIMHFESHFDRFRPVVQQRWREQAGAGTGIWFDLGSHLIDQALLLFGPPQAIQADLEIQRPGGTATDYFHAVLHYGKRRAILHASALVAAESPRFTLHGTTGSFIKFGLDPQEAALKAGTDVHSASWGVDARPGTLTRYQSESTSTELIETERGDYLAYYEGVGEAIRLGKANPVTAEQARLVMELLELGEQSAQMKRAIAFQPD